MRDVKEFIMDKGIITAIMVGVLVGLCMLIFAPFITIWSINTIFNTAIVYSFKTWFAVIWLQLISFGGIQSAIKGKTK